jgi:hypothetical protein
VPDEGEPTGDFAGLAEAVGLAAGTPGGFCSPVGVSRQDENVTIAVAKIIPNPKSKIPHRDGLLILLMFICIGQSHF